MFVLDNFFNIKKECIQICIVFRMYHLIFKEGRIIDFIDLFPAESSDAVIKQQEDHNKGNTEKERGF